MASKDEFLNSGGNRSGHLEKWGTRRVSAVHHLRETHRHEVTGEQAGDLSRLRALHASMHPPVELHRPADPFATIPNADDSWNAKL